MYSMVGRKNCAMVKCVRWESFLSRGLDGMKGDRK